ncbi:MAG: type III polyketide synthase [Alphaproteobacteria bacterium]|nr:type III polyketide synthase [Alphaproteobacteria bacterium]
MEKQLQNNLPKVISIATSVPCYKLNQQDVKKLAIKIFDSRVDNFSRFLSVYDNASIQTRYSCVPLEWFENPIGLAERNALYIKNALNLLEEATIKSLDNAYLKLSDIDGIVVVSSSGIATPSLDALLMERLKFRRTIERLPIFGLGCAGGVIGLARTAQLAKATPQKRYLYMVVELCGLTFLYEDKSRSNIIATALFGDGASACIISCNGYGPEIMASHEHTWPDTLDVMGWGVTNHGLKAIFSQDIPTLIRNNMYDVVDYFLKQNNLSLSSIKNFLCHPGGTKVLDALEEILNLKSGSLIHSRTVMKNFGNMSAATIMFVLELALKNPQAGLYLLSSLGPGFTAALLLMRM